METDIERHSHGHCRRRLSYYEDLHRSGFQAPPADFEESDSEWECEG